MTMLLRAWVKNKTEKKVANIVVDRKRYDEVVSVLKKTQ